MGDCFGFGCSSSNRVRGVVPPTNAPPPWAGPNPATQGFNGNHPPLTPTDLIIEAFRGKPCKKGGNRPHKTKQTKRRTPKPTNKKKRKRRTTNKKRNNYKSR